MKRLVLCFLLFAHVFRPLLAAGIYGPEELLFQDMPVIVTAAKHSQNILQVPASAYVITAQDIEAYGYRTLAEALHSVPGVYVSTDRNYSFIWFRGFGRPGDYNSRILTLINGHRVNDNLYGYYSPDHAFPLDMKTVERIEVIKGPGSALYGDNAYFGIVNIVTKTAKNAPLAQINAEAGSFGTSKGFLSFSQVIGDGGYYAAASGRRMQGQKLFFSDFESVNNGIADHRDQEEDYDLYASLEQWGFTFQASQGERFKGIPTGAWKARFNDPNNHTRDANGFVELKTERNIQENISLTGRVYYDWYNYIATLAYDFDPPTSEVFYNRDRIREGWAGEEFRVRMAFLGEDNALMLGQEHEKMIRGLQENFDTEPYQLYVRDDSRISRSAFFAQQELKPHRSLGLTLGARYDRYKSFGKAISPRLATVYQPWKDSSLKLMYGTAFRAPNPYEMFWVDNANAKPNPNLHPEKIRTYEVYWEQQFNGAGNNFTVNLDYYFSKLTELINQTEDPADNLNQFVNNQDMTSAGLEIGAKWRVGREFSGHAGYLLQDTRATREKERLSNSPRHTGTAGVTKSFWESKLRLSLQAFYVGARKSLPKTDPIAVTPAILPAKVVPSFGLVAQPWKQGPTLYFHLYNFSNSGYAVVGHEETEQQVLKEDERNFIVGVKYEFGPPTHRP